MYNNVFYTVVTCECVYIYNPGIVCTPGNIPSKRAIYVRDDKQTILFTVIVIRA